MSWALGTCTIANTHIWRNNNSWASSCHIKVWFKKSRFLLATISWYIINIKNFKGRVLYLVFVKDYLWCSFCFEIWEFGKSLKKEHVFFSISDWNHVVIIIYLHPYIWPWTKQKTSFVCRAFKLKYRHEVTGKKILY